VDLLQHFPLHNNEAESLFLTLYVRRYFSHYFIYQLIYC
jgi:hypothetical protein